MDGERTTTLSRRDRWLLAIPLAGGAVFGLLPLLVPELLGAATGYAGDDPYIGRLGGAATLGYAVALLLGIRDGRWPPLRAVVVATLTFNLVSVVACTIEIAADRAQPVVFLIGAASILISLIAWTLLVLYGGAPQGPRDVATWLLALLAAATVAAAFFGIAPLFPEAFARLAGYHGTDVFLYRQAGAATAGYAVMGIWELRSGRWTELRLPLVMALVFNGASFLASLVEIARQVTLLDVVVAPASLLFTVGFGLALTRRGR